MATSNLMIMNGITATINTAATAGMTPAVESPLSEGIENIAEALNETVQQYFFMDGKGYAANYVTGMAPALTLTGKRVVGDAAQDWIFSKKYKLMKERETTLTITKASATGTEKVTCPIAVCNVQEISGNANEPASISFELRFNGAPTVTAAE